MSPGQPQTASQPSPDFPGLRLVAWTTATNATTVRTTKRHLARESAFDGTGPRETLCGRPWRVSREVSPNDYWTDGACTRCVRAAQ